MEKKSGKSNEVRKSDDVNLLMVNMNSKFHKRYEISLIGMSHNQVRPLGYFQEVVKMDGEEYPLTIYVIPDGSAPLLYFATHKKGSGRR